MSNISEILQALETMPNDQKAELEAEANKVITQTWIPNPGPQTEAFYCKADELFYGGCVSGDTEFLTPTGWKRINQYRQGDLVAQWAESGELNYISPLGYTDAPCKKMWHFHNSRVSMMLSDEHRMPLYQYDGKFVVKNASDVAKNPSRHHIPNIYQPKTIGMPDGSTWIRLGVAILADGSLTIRKNKPGSYCRVSLRKTRKKIRLVNLLKNLNIEWHEYHNPNRPTEVRYSFESDLTIKHFDARWWQASPEQLEVILDEMSYWDGAYSGTIGGDICFNTTSKEDADFIQYVAHSCGRTATIGVRAENGNHSAIYRVHITTKGSSKTKVVLRVDAIEIDRVVVDRMYCFKTPTSFWLARHNGNIFVTGNSAGGGKSALLVGLSQTSHERSLILRRYRDDAKELAETELIDKSLGGDRAGWNGADLIYRGKGHITTFGGCQAETDKQRYKGKPSDLKGFDELPDFLESQYEFIIAWNRTTTKGQRCRIVSTGNPPTTAEGLWIIRRWAAWLDPSHHNPAVSGELRWFTRDEEGKEIEVEGRGPHMIGERETFAKSRTFIRAGLQDNPDLAIDGQYEAMLSQLPKELRDAYRDGKFDVALKDGAFQTIPTNWIRAAQARWTEKPPAGVPMCAIGVDVAQGGEDNTVLAPRHDGWFAPFITVPGKLTPDGKSVAGLVVANRRDNAKVIIDMGGGYGGAAYEHMKDNHIEVKGYKGAEGYSGRTSDRQLNLYNTRSAAYWRFREALDPSQPGGSTIMLPDDPEMVADLTAPTYAVTRQGIQVEPKKDVVKRLGRSPDIGDAVVMSWFDGLKGANIQGGFKARNTAPVVVMSSRAKRRKK